jgi:hypothetical protein
MAPHQPRPQDPDATEASDPLEDGEPIPDIPAEEDW